jgi:hypothetical protein
VPRFEVGLGFLRSNVGQRVLVVIDVVLGPLPRETQVPLLDEALTLVFGCNKVSIPGALVARVDTPHAFGVQGLFQGDRIDIEILTMLRREGGAININQDPVVCRPVVYIRQGKGLAHEWRGRGTTV